MKRRGHDVRIFCIDYRLWSDDMTRAAEQLLEIVDPSSWYSITSGLPNRTKCEQVLEAMRLDLIVVAEVPLTGILLDSAICAVHLGVKMVLLDNTHNPFAPIPACTLHGLTADGMVLVGLSSFHPSSVPTSYCTAPPLIEKSEDRARNFLADLGLRSDRLITVLAGGETVEDLAVNLLNALPILDCCSVFLSNDVRRSFSALANLPFLLRRKVRVLSPPEDDVLFGFLQLSRLVIGKCGFMQIAEALALQTPFLGVHHAGSFDPKLLPPEAARFVHATGSSRADLAAIEATDRFFKLAPGALASLHNGQFGSAPLIADFLERLSSTARSATAQSQT